MGETLRHQTKRFGGVLRTLPAVGQPDYCVSQGHARSLYLGYFKMFFCFDSVRRFRGARMIASGFGGVFYSCFCENAFCKLSTHEEAFLPPC